ncbi:MAG: hypothetical protein NZ898_13820 [Myxococcota bacterium]|nr:hypothetical protein [Myxococcota bacterium]MDW8362913.1 hypothetical protein [Myxococcales bacterium]
MRPILAVVALLAVVRPLAAQSERADDASDDRLGAILRALAARRLLAVETGSVEQLRELVRRGEQALLDGRWEDAIRPLHEVVQSPRFSDFSDLPEMQAAELALGRALERLGARRSAARYLDRLLARGPSEPYFGPGYRARVDVALASGDLAGALPALEAPGVERLPEDAASELAYVRGLERFEAGDAAAAEAALGRVGPRSRFYAAAQYLRGTLHVRAGRLDQAEARFCEIARQGERNRYAFFVDHRFFELKDLARLALGRLAHEQRRSDDAFYHYFHVPQDSPRLPEALFESAYAMYEGGDHETAIDLLDQLEMRFPDSPFADEASLLRGYVHLGRCEFDEADRLFRRFTARFEPLVAEIDRILTSPVRRERLFEDLLRSASDGRGADAAPPTPAARRDARDGVRRSLIALLRVDPDFYRLHEEVRTLDAEAARAGRLVQDLAALIGRLGGSRRPRPAAALDEPWDETGELEREIDASAAVLRGISEQLDAMRRLPAARARVEEIEAEVRRIGERIERLRAAIAQARAEAVAAAGTPGPGTADADDPLALLRADLETARRLPARVAATRARFVEAANRRAIAALEALGQRLRAQLRRARIGRIDAVMGSKRRVERQIESLAAGRFPPELVDPLRMQGLLRDDEEYWPMDGELWEDELEPALREREDDGR